GEGHSRQRGVAAVTTTQNPDAFRIGDTLSDQILDAPGDVVLHLVAPLAIPRVEKLLTVAGRGAEIRLQHGVPAVGKELGERIVAPSIPAPRASVRDREQR